MLSIKACSCSPPPLAWLQIVAACHCGKLSKPVRCSQSQFSCGKLCGRRLACGHRCPHKCHAGDCPACTLSATVTCHCGAESRTLACSRSDFHCNRVCGKALPCGRHQCERVCHGGACGGCPMEGPRLCPCGKVCHCCYCSLSAGRAHWHSLADSTPLSLTCACLLSPGLT